MNMGDGKHATSLAVNRSACAGIETAALEIGTGSQRSDITATTFHETLRPAMCFLRTRAVLPSRSRIVSASKVASYTRDASASVCTLAQLLPSQMSEPWHVSKPARQTRCRLHISMGAGVTDGRRGDQWGRRTVASVAFTVRCGRPSAERLGLPNASPSNSHKEDNRETPGKHDRVDHGHGGRVRQRSHSFSASRHWSSARAPGRVLTFIGRGMIVSQS